MATKGGVSVAECMLRSGAELSARVRLEKPELVEEAAHRSAGDITHGCCRCLRRRERTRCSRR